MRVTKAEVKDLRRQRYFHSAHIKVRRLWEILEEGGFTIYISMPLIFILLHAHNPLLVSCISIIHQCV